MENLVAITFQDSDPFYDDNTLEDTLAICSNPFKKVRILLVEDNPSIQYLYRAMLSALDCQVDFASNATEAFCMADNVYDLVFLDIGLPDKSGIEVAIELRRREIHKATRLIAVTAFTKELIQNECDAAGIELILTKPVHKKDIEALVEQTKATLKPTAIA